MLRIYDCECQSCGRIEEQLAEDTKELTPCSNCGHEMKRIFTSFNFRLKYDNKTDMCGWGVHGYERSAYWDNVKKARETDKNIKSPSCKY